MFSGLRTGRGWPVPALTRNNTFWAIYLGNLPGSACVIPTYHSNSCWKEMLIILLQYSNAATNCWYMLIYTQPKHHPMPPLNPLLGCLQQHPFTHSHGRCHRARCHRGKKLRRNQNWKLRTKRWPCKMGPSPPPQVSSHGRVVHLSNVQKSLWHSIIRTGWYRSLLAYRNPGRYQCNGFSRFS